MKGSKILRNTVAAGAAGLTARTAYSQKRLPKDPKNHPTYVLKACCQVNNKILHPSFFRSPYPIISEPNIILSQV